MQLHPKISAGEVAHNHHVAFDGWAGMSIHKGLATFDTARLTERLRLSPSLDIAREVRSDFRSIR